MSLDVSLINVLCEHCKSREEMFSQNITHNLGDMAEEAGIYGIVWSPEENGIVYAKQLIQPLRDAIQVMKNDPDRFRKFDSPNGWGMYDNFIPWLEKYLHACEIYPEAYVYACK